MSFPEVVKPLLDIRNLRTTYFRDGKVITVPLTLPPRNKGEGVTRLDVVMLDASPRFHRGDQGYKLILDRLNNIEALRYCITHSRRPVDLVQVMNNCGYGVVAMSVTSTHATFDYHGITDGLLRRDHVRLDAKCVITEGLYNKLYPRVAA